jgi:hypothetical protein
MTLEEHLHRNETLTAALRAALAAGDEAACAPLLARRADALTGLADALRDASAATRQSLGPRLRALGDADRDVRLAAEATLARLGEATRAGFGLSGRPAAPAPDFDAIPCLDRRA